MTPKYNYGPIFFIFQGLFYLISQISQEYWVHIYRFLIVSFLSLIDFLILYFIYKKYNIKIAILFFLNPVSIIITGYHNQFDNIAILLALYTILFYNTDKEINKNDLFYMTIMSLSLITKHIFFALPIFIFFRNDIVLNKKIIYAIMPIILFLISFIPFCISNEKAFSGIVNNVFLYRSFNNSPLLNIIYDYVSFPSKYKFYVYIFFMSLVGFFSRKYSYEKQLLIYLISVVTFSSAIANQYLVIPLVALCILKCGIFKYIYMIFAGLFLLIDLNALDLFPSLYDSFVKTFFIIPKDFTQGGYTISVWILLFSLFKIIKKDERDNVNE